MYNGVLSVGIYLCVKPIIRFLCRNGLNNFFLDFAVHDVM
jgi:hypothetical protein